MTPGPSPSLPWPPHTPPNTDRKPGERSQCANLYNHSKFAIFNDRSQLDFYYYSLIPAIILGAAGVVFPLINHHHWGDCIVPPWSEVWEQVWVSPRSLYVWTVTTLIVPSHARFWSISSSLFSQLFITLQSEKQRERERERERERNWRDKGWSQAATDQGRSYNNTPGGRKTGTKH